MPKGTIRWPLRLLTSVIGYAVTGLVIYWVLTNRGLIAPDVLIWDRVGDQAIRGISPYSTAYDWTQLFFYAPPWAFAFSFISWLPIEVQAGLIFVLELAALRYVAGSWLRVGYLGLCPITGGELVNGSLNLVMAAAVLGAIRGSSTLAGLFTLAKFSPVLAIRDGMGVASMALAALFFLPALAWWADWAGLLLYSQSHFSIGFPIPWLPRVALAVAVIALSRDAPWARVIAVFLAIPAMYSYSLVLLYPLLGDLRDRHHAPAGSVGLIDPALVGGARLPADLHRDVPA